ncbi:MAG TPA: hypothetical protein VFZ11_11655 [Gemmatimonadaceae bacterium]
MSPVELGLTSHPLTPDPDETGATSLERVRAGWPHVAVLALDVLPLHEGDPERDSVQACIALGALLPLDVVVDLVPSSADRAAEARRMFSASSFENERYLYETTVSGAELEHGDWGVRVRPAIGEDALPDLAPVIRWFAVPASALGATAAPGHLLPHAGRAAESDAAPPLLG